MRTPSRVWQLVLGAVLCCLCVYSLMATPAAAEEVAAAAAAAAPAEPAAAAAAAAPAAAAAGAKAPAKQNNNAKGRGGKANNAKGKGKGKGKNNANNNNNNKTKGKVKVTAGQKQQQWSADDFLGAGKAKLGAGGGGGAAAAAATYDSDYDDSEYEEEDPSRSWEEEEELANWEEEDDDNMPKFVTLNQLNDTSKLARLKRHQLLRIGRSLLRDPKFNDCLRDMVLQLIETAKASQCAAPDINELAAAAAPPSDAAAPAAATEQLSIEAAVEAVPPSAADVVEAIVESAAIVKASGTAPNGRPPIPRNLAGEAHAQAAALKVQGVAAPSLANGQTVPQPTPYNPNRTVSFTIIGRTNEFPAPPTQHATITPQTEVFDVAVIGCGLSGLTAMYRLRNLSVVCLEWSEESGGIAAQQTKDNITWATGAAYAPVPYAAILDLWHEIGLPKPEEIELGKPRDSFWVDRNLYLGIWEEALDDLPEDWYEFKSLIDALDFAGMIGVPPLEREPKKARIFDQISAGELIENFGVKLKTMLDLYCRSALGSVCADISAMAFLDFYSDELYERVAFPGGTGAVTKRLVELILNHQPNRIRNNMWVYDIHHVNDTMVQVRYLDTTTGTPHALLASRVIMATPVNIGAKIISDLPEQQKAVMQSVEHMHYLVHNVHTPLSYFHASYDTWTADVSFTDIIVARWQEATMSNTPVPRQQSILSVYQPLPRQYWNTALTDAEVRKLTEEMLVDLEKLLPGYKTADSIAIDTHRWPGSINILRPGLSTGPEGAIMRANHNRIVFAGSNLGIPSLEEAIERGLIAAKELFRLRAADKERENNRKCDAGKQGIAPNCDAVDDQLSAKSQEEEEAAAQKRTVAAAVDAAKDQENKP